MAKYAGEKENRNMAEGLQAEQLLQLIKAIVMPEAAGVAQSEELECEETEKETMTETETEAETESAETSVAEGKRCYTVKEVQDMLGISRPTVYELLRKNEFRWLQIGNKYRISKRSFDTWLDQKMGSM